MKLVQKAKNNLFILAVAVVYGIVFIIKPESGIISVKNSAYYLKEMIMIMPVIFVLTALLDTWVPKEQIMRFLGKEAGIKGAAFSLILGSISAGPIYAAFPLCVMLHKKGASIRNLVIILSAWAVIKVPMLLNELKFLGFQFMAVRWVLTVGAILIFSWITAKLFKNRDLAEQIPLHKKDVNTVSINTSACMGCSLCTKRYSVLFGMEGGKAVVKTVDEPIDRKMLLDAANACPVCAITVSDGISHDDQ